MKIKEITPASDMYPPYWLSSKEGTYQMPGLFYARSCCRQVLQTGNRRKNQRKKYFLKICTKFSKETSDK